MRSGALVRAVPPAREEEEETPPPPEDEYPEPAEPEEEPWETEETEPEPIPEPEAEPDPKPEPVPAPPAREPERELSREQLYGLLASALPREVATRLDDEKSIRARLEGGVLKLEVVPGFLYGRVNRPELLKKLGDAVSALAGREIRASAAELTETSDTPRRSLDELKGFKEVHFI